MNDATTKDAIKAKYGPALAAVMVGEAELDTLLDAFPAVVPHLPSSIEKLSEQDREIVAGFSVFLQVAGRPPLPKEQQ